MLLLFVVLGLSLVMNACVGTPPTQVQLTRQESLPAQAVKVMPENDPLPPILHLEEWQQPIPLPGLVNTAGAEDSPFITPDGAVLYFFFTPDPNIPAEKQLLDEVTGIYVSHRQGNEWGQAERLVLQDPGKLALDGCAFVQGDILWFCSAREGYTGINFFTAQLLDGRWQNWQYIGNLLNHQYEMGEMHLSSDGQQLYFHSPRSGGVGKLDLWVTRWANGEWQAPENLTVLNSPEDEGWPFITQDGSELWFTRFYQGAPAIFYSHWDGNQWSPPKLIVSQFAGEPTLDKQGNLYLVHHFFRDGKMIEADIYVAYHR